MVKIMKKDLSLECYHRLMSFSWKLIRQSRKNLSQMGFTRNQYVVMRSIEPGEAVTLSEISSRAFKENSNVTALVDFLEERGIVRRIPDPRDRRIIRVELTKEGIQTREHVQSQHDAFIKGLFRHLDEDTMLDFLHIIDIFDKHVHECKRRIQS